MGLREEMREWTIGQVRRQERILGIIDSGCEKMKDDVLSRYWDDLPLEPVK